MASPQPAKAVSRGILLFNLGGPETPADVRPFPFNLFSDPDIIQIKSDLLRKLLAGLIAMTRQRKSRGLCRQIGGGSAQCRITDEQADGMRKAAYHRFPAPGPRPALLKQFADFALQLLAHSRTEASLYKADDAVLVD